MEELVGLIKQLAEALQGPALAVIEAAKHQVLANTVVYAIAVAFFLVFAIVAIRWCVKFNYYVDHPQPDESTKDIDWNGEWCITLFLMSLASVALSAFFVVKLINFAVAPDWQVILLLRSMVK